MSEFIKENLTKDEEIIYKAKLHLAFWFWPFILAVLCTIINNSLFIFIGALIILWNFLKYINTELLITNKCIISKHGIISKHIIEQNINKIESIQVNQGMFGRIFNYGTIIICGTGGSKLKIKNIENPFDFKHKFLELIK